MVKDVNKALKEASDVLIAYDVFNPDNDQRKSMLYCEEQFSVLANHYGNFWRIQWRHCACKLLNIKKRSTSGSPIFLTELNETFEKLEANVLEEVNHKLRLNQLKHEEMESYIAQHHPFSRAYLFNHVLWQLPMTISRNNEIF